MSNQIIRSTARENGVPLWAVARRMGISEPTMTRKLRCELPENEQKHIIGIIMEIAAEGRE